MNEDDVEGKEDYEKEHFDELTLHKTNLVKDKLLKHIISNKVN
jgi:hypothetical protein